MSDPFFDQEKKKSEENDQSLEDKKELINTKNLEKAKDKLKLPEIKVEKPEKKKDDKKKPKKKIVETKSGIILEYTKRQKIIATLLYISIVISCIVIVTGGVWAFVELLAPTGKAEAFMKSSTGFKIALIGGILAGLFFFVIFFYSLATKGIHIIMKITFRKRDLDKKYKDKPIIKIGAGALMLSIFAIIIGIIYVLIEELVIGNTGEDSIVGFLINLSWGQLILIIGAGLLILDGLAFALNYLWYNGYYLILKMVGELEE